MIYDYECPECGTKSERYVPKFEYADNEVCECGTPLKRVFSLSSVTIDVFEKNYIPEIDPNVRFRSWKHAGEVARDKGLRLHPEPNFPKDFDYQRRTQEKQDRHVCSVTI